MKNSILFFAIVLCALSGSLAAYAEDCSKSLVYESPYDQSLREGQAAVIARCKEVVAGSAKGEMSELDSYDLTFSSNAIVTVPLELKGQFGEDLYYIDQILPWSTRQDTFEISPERIVARANYYDLNVVIDYQVASKELTITRLVPGFMRLYWKMTGSIRLKCE